MKSSMGIMADDVQKRISEQAVKKNLDVHYGRMVLYLRSVGE